MALFMDDLRTRGDEVTFEPFDVFNLSTWIPVAPPKRKRGSQRSTEESEPLDVEFGDLLEILGPKLGNGTVTYLPSPKLIQSECLAIRSKWSDDETLRRRLGDTSGIDADQKGGGR